MSDTITDGNRPRHRRWWVRSGVAASVLVVLAVSAFAAWEAWWPANVDRRALDSFGPPVTGATVRDIDYISEGNVLCLDACVRLERTYTVPAGTTLGAALAQATATAHAAGYSRTYRPTCYIRRTARAQFACQISAQNASGNAVIDVTGTDPRVVTPTLTDGASIEQPPAGTPVEQVSVAISSG